MFLQNLRAKVGARLNGDRESGFTLIELLVVMLILGILAAIAIPAFFNQREKANDADAKSAVKTAQTAIETLATENNGSYASANGSPATLQAIEPALNNATLSVTAGVDSYTVTATADTTEHTFSIARASNGALTYNCTGDGGCSGGTWGSSGGGGGGGGGGDEED